MAFAETGVGGRRLTPKGHFRIWKRTWEKAHEWGDRIPIGVIYQVEGKPTYEEQVPALDAAPLVQQPFREWAEEDYAALEAEFL